MPPDGADATHSLIGPAAGAFTALLWVLTSLFFATAGRRIPVTAVNTVRIVLAIVLLGITHVILHGTLLPDIATQRQWIMLALSGLIGLSLCDQALFTAFVDIGPRRALLCMTTSPIFALGFGAAFLGEQIPWLAYVAIAVTIGGVLWVISERSTPDDAGPDAPPTRLRRGVILAMIGAVSQAAGGMFGKIGMGVGWLPTADQLDAQGATLVRMVFGLFGMAPIVLIFVVISRKGDGPGEPRRWTSGLMLTAAGTIVGPFLGVWMSLIAFKYSPLAVAQTLFSLSPVLILPFSRYVLRERVTRRAVIGAIVALLGASALAFSEQIQAAITG
ncbi:MAG: DMT family transporter [Planctomycetota bacterium]